MTHKTAMNPDEWNSLIARLPDPHVLQSYQWGQVKSQFGWQPYHQTWTGSKGQIQAASLILQRTISLGGFAARLRVLYLPKGPLLDWNNAPLRQRVLEDLRKFARRKGAIFIKIDPDVPLGSGIPGALESSEYPLGLEVRRELKAAGWVFSPDQIQFRNTVLIDLRPAEDILLSNMKPKTRYNIRLASRKGVHIRPGVLTDLPLLYQMYAETSLRDGFTIRDWSYYETTWRTFLQAGLSQSLIAEVEDQPVAAVILFRFGGRAWYLYGMSRQAHREKMPNALLQWEAMRWAKAHGCTHYDLWGAPDIFNESDPLWGVYRFKEGLGGQIVRHLGAWDLPVQPWLYRLYTQTLPRLLDLMRLRGKSRTRASIG